MSNVQTTTSGNAYANNLNLAGSRNNGGGSSQRHHCLYGAQLILVALVLAVSARLAGSEAPVGQAAGASVVVGVRGHDLPAGHAQTADGERAFSRLAPTTSRDILISPGSPHTVITEEPRLDVRAIVAASARRHGVDPAFALAIVECESHFDPLAVGDHGAAVGAWQFHLPTALSNGRILGIEGDFRRDPYLSSEVASWMLSRGQAWAWTCANVNR